MRARDVQGVVTDAFGWEVQAMTASHRTEVGYFNGCRARAETRWVDALVALLTWAPPVEVRPKLHGPSPEALARGLVVGAVVRPDWRTGPSGSRMTVLGHSTSGHVVTCDGLWHAGNLTVVLPPPALDSWLLSATTLRDRFIDGHPCGWQDIAAEARRLVELVRGGAR